MAVYAIVLAGGNSSRMHAGENKIFLPLRGVPAIVRAIAPFSSLTDGIVLVARQEEQDKIHNILRGFGLQRLVHAVVAGGEDRQASVANGLAALPEGQHTVLVHDGARALVTESVIQQVLTSVQERGSGVAAVPVTDTVKRAAADGKVLETIPRAELYAMQTPQGFPLEALAAAHRHAAESGFRGTDDAALLEHAGQPVYLCKGDPENIKLTSPMDVTVAEAILLRRAEKEVLS